MRHQGEHSLLYLHLPHRRDFQHDPGPQVQAEVRVPRREHTRGLWNQDHRCAGRGQRRLEVSFFRNFHFPEQTVSRSAPPPTYQMSEPPIS